MKKAIILILAICFSAAYAIPTKINYQGVLKDSAGNLINAASLSVLFSIYDSPTNGILKWSETQNVTVEVGLYSVQLGSTHD